MTTVIKRNGSIEPYDLSKIHRAITLAAEAADPDNPNKSVCVTLCTAAVEKELKGASTINIEDIQNIVENVLMSQ